MNQQFEQIHDSSPDHHIIYDGGMWSLIPDGAEEPVRTFNTRDEAVRWVGRSMSQQGVNIVVHNEDGSINSTIRPES